MNGKQSTVNKSLDGSMYPGEKLAHSALGKKIIIVKNATAYTWDWYCHLVVDRASLLAKKILKCISRVLFISSC
jgi:hypothetical protein